VGHVPRQVEGGPPTEKAIPATPPRQAKSRHLKAGSSSAG
jgi:hypothetical protein